MLIREEAQFDLAIKLRAGEATVGEAYSFISGLYFRGKMAYSGAFAAVPADVPSALVIVPGKGLVPADQVVTVAELTETAHIPVEESNAAFCGALRRGAQSLDEKTGAHCCYVLLGSVASGKYTKTLLEVFGERLLFPSDFVGRGDMSRGGLMLRAARSGNELAYVPVQGAVRRGVRPPRLEHEKKAAGATPS